MIHRWAERRNPVGEKHDRTARRTNVLLLTLNAPRYRIFAMIRTFQCKETEKIFHRTQSTRFPAEIQEVALRKLRMLNRSAGLDDLRVPPANRLEKLSGNRAGQYSIRINSQWRICFEWRDGDVFNVEIVDYH